MSGSRRTSSPRRLRTLLAVLLAATLAASCTGSGGGEARSSAEPTGDATGGTSGASGSPGSPDRPRDDPACQMALLIEADVVLGRAPIETQLIKDEVAHRCLLKGGPSTEIAVLLYRPATSHAVLEEARSEGARVEGPPGEAYLVGRHVVALVDDRVFGFSARIRGRFMADLAVRAAAWAIEVRADPPEYQRPGKTVVGRCLNVLQPTGAGSVLGGPVVVHGVDRAADVCRYVGGLDEGSLIRVRLFDGDVADEVFDVARRTGVRVPVPLLGFPAFSVGHRVFVQAGGVYVFAVFIGGEPDAGAAVRLVGGIFPYWV